jgi:hypothetical protein
MAMAHEHGDTMEQDIQPSMTVRSAIEVLGPPLTHERARLRRHELEQRLITVDLERASLKASRMVAKAVLKDATAMAARAQAALTAAQERARQVAEHETLLCVCSSLGPPPAFPPQMVSKQI